MATKQGGGMSDDPDKTNTDTEAEREQTLQALKASEHRFRQLAEGSPVGIFIFQGMLFRYVNQAAARTFGYPVEEMLKRGPMDLTHPDDHPAAAEYIQACMTDPEMVKPWAFRGLHRDGSLIDCEVVGRFTEMDGAPAIIGTMVDVSERKRAERSLMEQNSFRQAIIEKAAEGLCVCHEIPEFPNVTFTVWNPRMTELTGYTMEEINRLGWYQSVYPDSDTQKRAAERMARMRDGFDLVDEEWEISRKDGDTRLISISTSILTSHDGKAHVLALMRDLTERQKAEDERRRLEERIHHAQKLESLGVLAVGIAHDFNNLLMGVLGNVDMALTDVAPESPAAPCLKDIKTAAMRLADLTKQMLAYSGKGKFVVESLNLSRMVDEMSHLLEVSIPKKVVIKYDLAAELHPIRADASQVRQVIMNLITNAAEACGERSGVVSLRTGMTHLDRGYISETLPNQELVEGYHVFLEVSDTGCGMDEETRVKIFDPFFTTKFTGRGLGLSAVLGIMRGHHGAIKLYSEPGRGSTFKLFFPSAEESRKRPDALRGTEESWLGAETVLLVDDEETVRATTRRMLERIGFSVITASDGREAVNTIKKQGDQIDCVLLDFAMPRMDGIETFSEMRRLRHDLPVILSSGYNQQDATSHFAGKGLAGFIQKPYSLQELTDELKKALRKEDPD